MTSLSTIQEEEKNGDISDIIVSINDEKKKDKIFSNIATIISEKNPKTIARNMLLRASSTSPSNEQRREIQSPDYSVVEKKSPSIERKPYELGEIGLPELWTDDTVRQIIDFEEICVRSSVKCKKSSIKHRRIGHFIQILVILLGALSVAASIGNLDDRIKLIVNTIGGASVAILTSIQSFLKFPQLSEVEASSCLELERMSRSIRIELSKPKELRVDPFKYIIKLENQREKLLHRIGIEDD